MRSTSQHHRSTCSNKLLLASMVLHALEHRGLALHAGDYRELTQWATSELAREDTALLHILRRSAPVPLVAIAENILHERGEPAWSACHAQCASAKAATDVLLARL